MPIYKKLERTSNRHMLTHVKKTGIWFEKNGTTDFGT